MPSAINRKSQGKSAKGSPLMVKTRPASADWIRQTSKARRLQNATVIDLLVEGFKLLTPDQRAKLFGDGAGNGVA